MEFIGKDTVGTPSKEKIKQVVEKFFGPVAISGKIYNVDETIHRIQSMYARKAFERSDPKEKYEVIRVLNKELGIISRDDYIERASEHPNYIENPKIYFKDQWISWYHFLGIDTFIFPQTKSEWIRVCKDMGVTTWDDYKQKNNPLLPANPGEMYEDYINWDKEFGVEDEYVW
jgi:predicted nucleic-acid-binding protein